MKTLTVLAALLLIAACDLPDDPSGQSAHSRPSIDAPEADEISDDLDREMNEQQLQLDCFDGNQKSCDDLQKLREIDAVGDIVKDVAS